MSKPGDFETENRALALSALNLTKALMNALEAKGVLDGTEIQAVLDEALSVLEHRPQDQSTDIARRIIEAIIITRATKRPKPTA
ncbi:MAG TPA: hypothetical protein PLR76_14940 [Hyphomonas sp.]|nr:hypothetical protein [Hyphomonas sp.]HPE49697.1 hypothetical protein [Hyphomonas sp.]